MVANGMDPKQMAAEERITEVSTLLALGMMRLWLKRRRRGAATGLDERDISTGAAIDLDLSRNDGSV